MFLSISTPAPHAKDLGFLLHKHPDRFQSFELSFGRCYAFYPESSPERTTFCLLLDVDPVEMARKKSRKNVFALAGYVNDRPYVASSLMSVAISQVLGSALGGRCSALPELAETPLELVATLEVLPVKGGESFLRSVFEPLGYQIEVQSLPLDEHFPEWGDSTYLSVTLSNTICLSMMLSHLYVLIPVFDYQKHYFSGRDELEKLLSKGEGWLAKHPEKEAITRRYLKFQPSLVRQALERLVVDEENDPETLTGSDDSEESLETPISLNQQRQETVANQLVATGASRVIDLGCGEGKLLKQLIGQWQFKQISGMDVSIAALEKAHRRLRLDDLPDFQSERVQLFHGSLMYRDKRLAGFDAATLVEVIEHLDPPRLAAMERVVFKYAKPKVVVVTTPNVEYNKLWSSLPAGQMRHPDHRFEWTRQEFQNWSQSICSQYGYEVRFDGIGPADQAVGPPTQMAVFEIQSQNSTAKQSEPEMKTAPKTGKE